MKKTSPTKTAPLPARAGARRNFSQNVTPAPELPEHRPSEHTLLACTMERRSKEEQLFLYELLREFAKSYEDLPVIALRDSSHALGIKLHAEYAANYKEDFEGLTRVTIDDNGYLYRILHQVFLRVNKKETVTPEDLVDISHRYLIDMENDVDTARDVIRDNPSLVAKEIRQAVAERADLFSDW